MAVFLALGVAGAVVAVVVVCVSVFMVFSFLAVLAVVSRRVSELLRQFVMHRFDSGTFNALALLAGSENLSVSFCFIVKILFGFVCPRLFIHHLHPVTNSPPDRREGMAEVVTSSR